MSQGFYRILPQILTLLTVVVLVTLFFPNFLVIGSNAEGRLVGPVIDVLKRSAPVCLLAIGMTLVIATKGIDLSVGAVIAICGAVSAWAVASGYGVAAAVALALAAGLVCGLWNGILVAVLGIQPIVATMILMVAGRGIAQLVTEGRILTFSNDGFAFLGSGQVLGLPAPVWIWVAAALAIGALVRLSAIGLLVEAVGVNQRASALAGINARVLIVLVYVASGLCAALAGVIVTADIRGADANNAGLWLELDAILAVVIGGNSLMGGRFSITAAVIGALIIQTIDTGIRLAGFPSEYNLMIKAAVIVVILVLQSPRLAPQISALALALRRPSTTKSPAREKTP